VTFDAAGPGAIIGVGNGDPNSHEPDKAAARGLYNGLAQPVVRPAPRGVRSPCWWKHSLASRRA
jgi:beta-galactosidase